MSVCNFLRVGQIEELFRGLPKLVDLLLFGESFQRVHNLFQINSAFIRQRMEQIVILIRPLFAPKY